MQTIIYKTGRIYSGSDQVLEINIEQQSKDEFDFHDIVATFVDNARNIKGRVEILVYDGDSVGKAVFNAYDNGKYSSI